jgi:hypothetical protein
MPPHPREDARGIIKSFFPIHAVSVAISLDDRKGRILFSLTISSWMYFRNNYTTHNPVARKRFRIGQTYLSKYVVWMFLCFSKYVSLVGVESKF